MSERLFQGTNQSWSFVDNAGSCPAAVALDARNTLINECCNVAKPGYDLETNETSFVVGVSTVPGSGVGLFATHNIAKGAKCSFFEDEGRFYTLEEANRTPRLKMFLQFYGVWKENGWWCSSSHSTMGVGWYMNHSKNPNVGYAEKGWQWIALRDIKAGEEIFSDYEMQCHEDDR